MKKVVVVMTPLSFDREVDRRCCTNKAQNRTEAFVFTLPLQLAISHHIK